MAAVSVKVSSDGPEQCGPNARDHYWSDESRPAKQTQQQGSCATAARNPAPRLHVQYVCTNRLAGCGVRSRRITRCRQPKQADKSQQSQSADTDSIPPILGVFQNGPPCEDRCRGPSNWRQDEERVYRDHYA